MGILSDLRKKSEMRKIKKKNNEEIEKVLGELKSVDSDTIMDDESKSLRKQYLITKFALNIKNGILKFDDIKEKEPLEIAEKVFEKIYPQVGEIGKEIRFSQMFREIEDEMNESLVRSGPQMERYKKIEKLALEFYEKYPDDPSRDLSIKPLSNLEVHNIICSYFEKGLGDGYFLQDVLKRMRIFTANKVIEQIQNAPNKKEQEKMYQEYVNDFLDGEESPKEYVVRYFEKSEFLQERNRRKKCEELGVEYNKEPLIIYEGTEKAAQKLDDENRKRAEDKLYEKTTVSDLVMVRTTNVFPKNGVVEILDKHSMPEFQDSFFKREIKDAGLDLKEFETYSFVNRRTSHWTLNGLVSSHMYGSFDGRNFIIIEPFEEQVNNDGLLSIDESDTYFEGDLKLSDKAIVLMKLEEYKERYKDPTQRKEMEKMNIRLFTGNEKIAVNMLLQELGYVYEDIGMWGYSLDTNTPELKYARNLEDVMKEETERLQKEGKNVETVTHFYSKSREIDSQKTWKLELERIDKFVELLAENVDINFSPKYLKRIFINRATFKNDQDDHYLDSDIEEPEGLVKMTPQEIFDKIGPDKIKEVTDKFNENMLEEHKEARKQKDKELIEKGFVTKDEKEGQEVVE